MQMTKSITPIFIILLAGLQNCHGKMNVGESSQTTAANTSATSKLLVIGDIQQKDEFLYKFDPFTQTQWDHHGINTTGLSSLDPKGLIENAKPDAILQMGDFVNFNNGFEIAVKATDGSLFTLKPKYDEWKTVLSFFPTSVPIYPTTGNHDAYKLIRFHGTQASHGVMSITAIPDPKLGDVTFSSDQERYQMLTSNFPHLRNSAQFFDSASGTYFVQKDNYCLLSIDGSAIVKKDLQKARAGWDNLKPFIEGSLAKCSTRVGQTWMPQKPTIVTIHYPLFSALIVSEQEFLDEITSEVTKTFNEFRVALVLSGHEHLYMRHREKGHRDAGYSKFLPLQSIYVTVANFGVPKTNHGAKLREANRGPGNGSTFFLTEDPTVASIMISKNTVKFAALTRVENTWKLFDRFDLRLSSEGTWELFETVMPSRFSGVGHLSIR